MTDEEVKKIARLAWLDSDFMDLREVADSMSKILEWVGQLSDVDVSLLDGFRPQILSCMGDVERDSGVSVSHLRMDEPHLDMTKRELFENAPDECGGFFVVPKAVE